MLTNSKYRFEQCSGGSLIQSIRLFKVWHQTQATLPNSMTFQTRYFIISRACLLIIVTSDYKDGHQEKAIPWSRTDKTLQRWCWTIAQQQLVNSASKLGPSAIAYIGRICRPIRCFVPPPWSLYRQISCSDPPPWGLYRPIRCPVPPPGGLYLPLRPLPHPGLLQGFVVDPDWHRRPLMAA
jgi:hypothetical protein